MAAKTATLAEQISARANATRETARREWASLCRAAISGDAPDLVVIEDLGAALGIDRREAVEQFEGDVAALKEYPAHLAASDQAAAEVRELIEPFTNHDGLAVALQEAFERLDLLKRTEIQIHYSMLTAGQLLTRARYVASAHPRVLGAEVAR